MNGSSLLFNSNGKPSAALLELLALFEIQHDGTLSAIRDATQAAWYHAGKFRAEITEKHADKKDEAMKLFQRLGFLDAVYSSYHKYRYALVLGATVVAVRKRIAFLRSEWWRGIRFDSVFLLASDRLLMEDKESRDVLLKKTNLELPFEASTTALLSADLPTDEATMMRFVYETASSRLPFGDLPMQVVVAPKLEKRNAGTGDTFRQWNELSLPAGKILVVSSQPFVSYQGLITRKILGQTYQVDCIGCASAALPVTVYLDNVARIVYELAT